MIGARTTTVDGESFLREGAVVDDVEAVALGIGPDRLWVDGCVGIGRLRAGSGRLPVASGDDAASRGVRGTGLLLRGGASAVVAGTCGPWSVARPGSTLLA